VLRSGGRLVAAVWAGPEENLWLSALAEEAARAGHAPPPDLSAPGAFALSGAPGARSLGELIEDAGLDEPVLEPLDLVVRAPSADALWDMLRAISSTMAPVLAALSPADHYRLRDAVEQRWAPYVAADGTIAIPGRAIGAVTEA
jgi:hypothetical protein